MQILKFQNDPVCTFLHLRAVSMKKGGKRLPLPRKILPREILFRKIPIGNTPMKNTLSDNTPPPPTYTEIPPWKIPPLPAE
jgi:hypothetical protein